MGTERIIPQPANCGLGDLLYVIVEMMIATGRIDMVVETTNFIYVLELKLSNNGGVDAATEQMKAKQYAEPFKADKRKVIALAIELDDMGKGLVDWKEV